MNNDMSRFLHSNSEYIGNAYIHGRLYALEGYPGAVVNQHELERVYGHVLKIEDPQEVFKVLDAYEGIGDGTSTDYEYVRTQVVAYLDADTQLKVWFYAYNFPTDTLRHIPYGRYL